MPKKPVNPFERQTYTYSDLKREIWGRDLTAAYEKIGTPSFFALCAYVFVVVAILFGGYYFADVVSFLAVKITWLKASWNSYQLSGEVLVQYIVAAPQNLNVEGKISNETFKDISYLPSLISGIATFGFALLFFIAEAVDKSPYRKTVIQKTLIFPLVVSSITTFTVLVFFPLHRYSLGAICIYLGLMALIGSYHLFNFIWKQDMPEEGGGIPGIVSLYRLFLYEIYSQIKNSKFKWLNRYRTRKLKKLKDEADEKLNEFVDRLLTYPSPKDEDYMVYLGRMLVHMRNILSDNDFIKSHPAMVPELLAPYLQTILFHDADITKLQKKDKEWIRRAAYLTITNAELALEARASSSMSRCLTMVSALYGVLNENKELRDDFLERICRWINEFAAFYVEPKLFENPKDMDDYEEIVSLSEIVFTAYSGPLYRTYESGLEENSDKNFRAVLSAFSRVYDDFLRGTFGAKRDIERLAEQAEYWLKNPEYADKKPHEYVRDIEIDKCRRQLEIKKRGMLACLAAIIFRERKTKGTSPDSVLSYFRALFQELEISIQSLIPLYLQIPSELDDAFGLDTYLSPRTYTEKPEVYAVPNIVYDLLPPALVRILLEDESMRLPMGLEYTITGEEPYRLEKLIKAFEEVRSETLPDWAEGLPSNAAEHAGKIIELLEKMKEQAEEVHKEKIRNMPLPPNAQHIFKEHVLKGYSKGSEILRNFVRWGLEISYKTDKKYEGEEPAMGYDSWQNKESIMSVEQLEHLGKMYGERIADEEGGEFFKQVIKHVPQKEVSIKNLLSLLASEDPEEVVLITEHMYWFDALIRSKTLLKNLSPFTPSDKAFKEYGNNLRGYIKIGSKLFPVLGFHADELDKRIFIIRPNNLGTLIYATPEFDKEPLRDSTTSPLFADIYIYSEHLDEVEKLANSKKTFTDIPTKEGKAKRLKELVKIRIFFRLVFEPNTSSIQNLKLSIKGKSRRKRKLKKKR